MKFLFGAVCAPFVMGVVQWANTTMAFIILLAAAVAAMGVIWSKVVMPFLLFCRAAGEAVDHVRSIPEVLTRLEIIEGALYGTGAIDSLPIRRRDDPPYDQRRRGG